MNREQIINKKELLGSDYRLFQSTPAWELAKAVWDEDISKIEKIVDKDNQLINFQDPILGSTLLMFTIRNQQYKSFEVLLKNKANVHIHNTYDGSSALIEACSSSFYNLKFIKTLLKYGANVNDVQVDVKKDLKTRTPLMLACTCGEFDFVEILITKGAIINYQNESKQSALSMAVLTGRYKIVTYLLKNGADYNKPIIFRDWENRDIYLLDLLRESFLDLDSNEYKHKMEIVDFLKEKGVDYRFIPIPEYIKKKAKEYYPDNWEDYLEKY